MPDFPGFPSSTLTFLRELREHNQRDWFDAHREDYERCYLTPARVFVEAAAPALRQIAPNVRAEPRILGSIFRINRDTRFSKDKRPYKDHLDFWFWEGERKGAVSGFFVRISPDSVGIGAGSHGFDRQQLAAYRRAARDPGLTQIASALTAAGYQLGGGTELAKRSDLFVHVDAPSGLATDPRLLDECTRHWRQLAPLHRWLMNHIGPGPQEHVRGDPAEDQRPVQPHR